MTIAIVQHKEGTSFNGTVTFDTPVLQHSAVIIIAGGYSFTNTPATFSGGELGSQPIPHTTQLAYEDGADSRPATAAAGIIILPNVPAGAQTVTLNASSNQPSIIALEVSGLGTAPRIDVAAPGGNGAGTSPSSGATPSTRVASSLILGCTVSNESIVLSGPGAGWTEVRNGTGEISAGWQIQSSANQTYTYATGNQNPNAWAALCIAIAPGDPVPGSNIALRSAGPPVASGSPAYGAATVAGDLGISMIFDNSGVASPYSITQGYAVVPSGGAGGPFESCAIAYKQGLSAGETAPVWTVAGAPGSIESVLLTFKGAAISGGPMGTPVNGGTAGQSSQSVQMGAGDATPGGLIVFVCGWNGGASAPSILNGMTDSAGAIVAVNSINNAGGNNFIYDFCWGVTGSVTGSQGDLATGYLSAFSNGGCGLAVFAPAPSGSGLLMASYI